MMNKHPRSSVWNYFQKDDDMEYAICMITGCKAKIKQAYGNTSSLLKHLKTNHIKKHEECVKEMKANEEKRKKSTNNPITQMTIEHSIAKSHVYPRESTKRKNIDDALV